MDLTLPFALLGLVGGWIAADVVSDAPGFDAELHAWLLVLTPLAAAAVGRLLTRRAVRGTRREAVAWTIGAVAVAGPLVGVVVALGLSGACSAADGFVDGVAAALAFLPALGLVVAAARRVGRARAGSLVDVADRRAIWVAALAALAIGSVTAHFGVRHVVLGYAIDAEVERTIALVAAAGVALLAIVELTGLVRGSLARAALARMRTRDSDAAARREAAVPTVDLGIGDAEAEEVARPAAVYRDVERVLRVVRGDPERSRAALRWAVACALFALALSCAAIAAHALT